MAAPPWRATDQRTLHWYSQGHCDHQWPTHVTPESPGKAVHSRGGVALFTWQPPLKCQGLKDPPLEFTPMPWSSLAHWSLCTVPREGCALQSRRGSLHMAAPPDVPRTHGPSIGICTGGVIINDPLVILQSPQGTLCTLEAEWLSSHGSPPLKCQGLKDPPLEFTPMPWSSMAHWSFSRVPRERCALKRRSSSLHMAAHPDVPRTRRPSIEIHINAVIISGPLVSLHSPQGTLCTQEAEWLSSHGSPPVTCHGPTDPPLVFTPMSWSSMAHWSFSTVPREGCALQSRSGSPHMAAPPGVPRTRGPSNGIHTNGVIINGPLVTLHTPQGTLCTLEAEWLSSHGSPPLTCHGLKDPPLEFARE